MLEEFRRCRRCDKLQVITEFYPNSRNKGRRQFICRTCSKADAARWRNETRERFTDLRWRRELRSKYGITADDYYRMFSEQGGRCGGCGSADPGPPHGRVFAVDHCHTTGRVRGLLCTRCNVSLGQMKESGDRLRGLAAYADRECGKETKGP